MASKASRIGQWRYERGGGFAAQKGSQPRLAALVSPFQGKGLAWILPPSYGRRCPEGAEVGWGKRYEKERVDRLKCVAYESTRAPLRDPPSPMGKATIREHRYPHIVRANTCMCEKTIPPTKPSPRGEGGERSEPDRVLATRKISGKIVSSRQFTRAPERRYAVPLPQGGKATDTRMSLFSHRQSEYRIRGEKE